MNFTIIKREITQPELAEIAKDIGMFPDLAFLKPGLLKQFSEIYVAEYEGVFAGFCAVEMYKGIRKLGPIAVKVAYQNHGIGMEMMRLVLKESEGKRTYFGTSNQKLRQYGLSVGAREYTSLWSLPQDVRSASIHFLLEYISFKYVLEAIRKFIKYGRHKYTYFILP